MLTRIVTTLDQVRLLGLTRQTDAAYEQLAVSLLLTAEGEGERSRASGERREGES